MELILQLYVSFTLEINISVFCDFISAAPFLTHYVFFYYFSKLYKLECYMICNQTHASINIVYKTSY